MSNCTLNIGQINVLLKAAEFAKSVIHMSKEDGEFLTSAIAELVKTDEFINSFEEPELPTLVAEAACVKARKVIAVRFTTVNHQERVNVTYDDMKTEDLFGYYEDELTFVDTDILGKTRDEVLDLRHKRDVAFLQS